MVIQTSAVDLATSQSEVVVGDQRGDWTDDTAFTWQEIIASTTEKWGGFQVNIGVAGTLPRSGVVKIGTGGAGVETEIVRLPNRTVQRHGVVTVFCPIPVAAGVRLSVAMGLDAIAGGERQVQVIGFPEADIGTAPFSALDTGPYRLGGFNNYGRGVRIVAGATANTKGAWVEISQDNAVNLIHGGGLPHDYSHLGIIYVTEGPPSDENVLIDIAKGLPGSEVVIAENIHLFDGESVGGTNETPTIFWLPSNSIGAGERISARIQASAADHPIGLLLAGLR